MEQKDYEKLRDSLIELKEDLVVMTSNEKQQAIQSIEEIFNTQIETLKETREVTELINQGKETPSLDSTTRLLIEDHLKTLREKGRSSPNLEYVEKILKFAKASDEDINYDLFLPFIKGILENSILLDLTGLDWTKEEKENVSKILRDF